jgi:hypothetical protein
MPLMPYLAVIATGWIIYLPRAARFVATTVLVLAVVANTLATTFGVGGKVETTLVGSPPSTQAFPDRIVFYSNAGFLVAGPQRDGDVPGLLKALRREGVKVVAFNASESAAPDFSYEGLIPLAMIAGLLPSFETSLVKSAPTAVVLLHRSTSPQAPPMCTRLSDGTGVWAVRIDTQSGKLTYYCPFHHPRYYL